MAKDSLAPGSISRRRCLGTTLAALSTGIASKKGLAGEAGLGAGTEGRIPTLDELATGWLDCGLLAHMPSLHNFHEMAGCAPDLVGVNFFPGGQLYENSGPRWYIYNALPGATENLWLKPFMVRNEFDLPRILNGNCRHSRKRPLFLPDYRKR